jgi:hypothetical protein
MRVVNLNFTRDDLEQAAIVVDSGKAIEAVIGYLSLWSISYPTVDIYLDPKTAEFTAQYSSPEKVTTYVIGAVFNKETGKYGFHS